MSESIDRAVRSPNEGYDILVQQSRNECLMYDKEGLRQLSQARIGREAGMREVLMILPEQRTS